MAFRLKGTEILALALLAIVVTAHLTEAKHERSHTKRCHCCRARKHQHKAIRPPNKQFKACLTMKLNLTRSFKQSHWRDVSKHSLSPWNYIKDSNNLRFPSDIFQANCSTDFCIDLGMKFNSVPIRQEILVLKKEPNTYTYSLEKMTVTVGCTCVKPYIEYSEHAN